MLKQPILSREQVLKIVRKTLKENGDQDKLSSDRFIALAAALESALLEKLCGEPVAVISSGWQICYVGSGPIAPIVERHELKIGDKLYALNRSKA